MIRYFRQTLVLAAVAFGLGTGCSEQVKFNQAPPEAPKPPIMLVNTKEDAQAEVRSEVSDTLIRWEEDKIAKGKTIAILPVGGPETSGELVAAILTLKLKDAGLNVVERQVTRAMFDEFELWKHSSEPQDDRVKRLLQVLPADYFLAAGVSTLDSQLVNVSMPERKLAPSDIGRYQGEYEQWKKDANAYLDSLDEAAQIVGRQPKFGKSDELESWLLRNSIEKVRRDIEATGFVGIQTAPEIRDRLPLLVRPDFMRRADESPKVGAKSNEPDYSIVSPYGPYAGFSYRPLLVHLPEGLPKSAPRWEFELLQGRRNTFQVNQTSASIAFRLIDTSSSKYVGLGMLDVDDNSEPKALRRISEKLASLLAERLK